MLEALPSVPLGGGGDRAGQSGSAEADGQYPAQGHFPEAAAPRSPANCSHEDTNSLADLRAVPTAGNACLNKTIILHSNSRARILKASFSRLATFDLSNLELIFWSQIKLFNYLNKAFQ